ncbi:hypothetical protein DPMN_176147 [Dreissena polymorpha]|uniref:Uncharacterized protein n=1 Tax=Dreissena polymorpha TaxID=45954 RepID=A0A9D4IIW5_DREPO|nr:hypothetical protein DPMN_176147 [Dreissena polymorpha]
MASRLSNLFYEQVLKKCPLLSIEKNCAAGALVELSVDFLQPLDNVELSHNKP